AILDRIAAGLGTTFAALMGVGAGEAPEGVEVWSTNGGSWAVLLDAVETETLSVETWKWKLLGQDVYTGDGGMALPGPAHQVIEAGGSGRVASDGSYRYRAHRGQVAVFFSVALLARPGR